MDDQELMDELDVAEIMEADGWEETTQEDAIRLREAFARLTASLED